MRAETCQFLVKHQPEVADSDLDELFLPTCQHTQIQQYRGESDLWM